MRKCATLQEVIDKLIEIRDKDKISPNAPVSMSHDVLEINGGLPGYQTLVDSEGRIGIFGDDGYRDHGGPTTEADHEVHIYWNFLK